MKAIRKVGLGVLLLLSFSCNERYYPEDDVLMTGTLVVNAHLNNLNVKQNITLSRSDGLIKSKFIPESGCYIEIEDNDGATMEFTETEPGQYSTMPETDFITVGKEYTLNIITSNGTIYSSEAEILHESKRIDSVYFEIDTSEGIKVGDITQGIQFFIDFEIEKDLLSYYRWEVIETYEYRNPNYDDACFIYDTDRKLRPLPEEDYYRTCWITDTISQIYTQSTVNLSGTSYLRQPLHFVTNQTQRLQHGYSVLIRQHVISQKAYKYWNDLRKNSNDEGILGKQPSLAISNICNSIDPEEHVLGFFSISGASERRVFLHSGVIDVPHGIFCFPEFEFPQLYFFPKEQLPLYLAKATWPYDGIEYFGLIRKHCIDCRVYKGSASEMPDFWQ